VLACYAAAVARKPQIAVVGAGRLARALASELNRAGYRVDEIISRNRAASQRKARALGKVAGARATRLGNARLDADLIWFCVSDGQIGRAARDLIHAAKWRGKIAFHSSGALSSDELDVLRSRGTAVASVHPLMTFVRGSIPSLQDVPFGVEGDAVAARSARQIVRDLGGKAFMVRKDRKGAYHAWGTFLSPLLVAMLITAEQVAREGGISASAARRNMLPIVRQTVANYVTLGPAGAFSGPLVRGDAAIIRQHLRVLRKTPDARKVYLALAGAALQYLPVKNRKKLKKLLDP
jgi:predicted short-subunit dehydrogenase-like oxidoreductase (DUF2520 family)